MKSPKLCWRDLLAFKIAIWLCQCLLSEEVSQEHKEKLKAIATSLSLDGQTGDL
jgi:hypothetical protein